MDTTNEETRLPYYLERLIERAHAANPRATEMDLEQLLNSTSALDEYYVDLQWLLSRLKGAPTEVVTVPPDHKMLGQSPDN